MQIKLHIFFFFLLFFLLSYRRASNLISFLPLFIKGNSELFRDPPPLVLVLFYVFSLCVHRKVNGRRGSGEFWVLVSTFVRRAGDLNPSQNI